MTTDTATSSAVVFDDVPMPVPGAHLLPDGRCSFALWAPYSPRVELDVDGTRHTMAPRVGGYHEAIIDDVLPGARYGYRLGGGDMRPDPASRHQPDGVHERSAVISNDFAWSDGDWFGVPLREYVLYELHVGTFTPGGTFDAIIPRLDQLAELGITAIELMPIAQFPGDRNWGYDGVALFAVQGSYGGPDGLRRLVDAAHARGIAVVLDVVYNHLGPEGNYLREFGPYFTDRHSTPWGDAVNVDGRGSDHVRSFFTHNACMWIEDFHIDALRLDAIHGIVDASASPFLQELAESVHDCAEQLNRRAYVIAESDLNDPRVITERAAGGLGHDAQWNDDFHHSVHALLTGERDGYYADYAEALESLAASYRHGFVYTGQRSEFRARRHGAPTHGLPGERFVVYAQNHDQVGNRLRGDRLSTLVDDDRLRLAAAVVLLSPFVPMLFMGEEYGERRPFPYFVSHTDPALVAAVREGRKREFAEFSHVGEAPDPQSTASRDAAVLDWDASHSGQGGALRAFVAALLRERRRPSIARMRNDEAIVATDARRRVMTVRRSHAGDESLVIFNFGSDESAAGDHGIDDSWHVALTSVGNGGASAQNHTIAPMSVAMYGRRLTDSPKDFD